MQHNTMAEVRELGRRWAEAEQRNDAGTLEILLADDFRAVGPRGFVLDKQQWLERYRSGTFVTQSLTLDEVDVRIYGPAAVAIGRQTQQATYGGHPTDGQFRVTLVATRTGERWVLA